jgi:hypothetical protein
MKFNAEVPATTAGGDDDKLKSERSRLGARYIGKTPLRCAMLKTARLLQGPVKKWG